MIYTIEEFFKNCLNDTIYNVYFNSETQKFEFHYHSKHQKWLYDVCQITKKYDNYYIDWVEKSEIWVTSSLMSRYHINKKLWKY
jgi:hypothetical protein